MLLARKKENVNRKTEVITFVIELSHKFFCIVTFELSLLCEQINAFIKYKFWNCACLAGLNRG